MRQDEAVNKNVEELQLVLDGLLEGKRGLRVLEAGCGSASRVTIGRDPYVVGIDVSQEQLDRNVALREKILGDIQEYDLPKEDFDVIVCWDVLEHLPHPEKAITNFANAVKIGGLVILAFPNPRSLKALITKMTPHWFHVWAYRHVFGHPLAGIEGRGPFRTYLRSSLNSRAFLALVAEHGLTKEYFEIYEGVPQVNLRCRFHLTGLAWRVFRFLVRLASLGRIDAERTDCLIVMRKAGGQ